MEYRIIPAFLNSFSKLSRTNRKSVRNRLTAISSDFTGTGLRLHKLAHPSSAVFSYSVNRDIRIIAHRDRKVITMLYVDHHDAAYAWIERRRLVSMDNTLRIIIPRSEAESAASDDNTPPEFTESNMESSIETYTAQLALMDNDDSALGFIENLPVDENTKSQLLDFVISRSEEYAILPEYLVRALDNDVELAEALEYPLDLWRVFLHPRQLEVVQLPLNHSSFITGGPGTGKTVCLVHRIKHVIQHISSGQHVLLITYREQMSGYIKDMMHKIHVDTTRVFFVDVNGMNETHVINVTTDVRSASSTGHMDATYRNCFVIDHGRLYYYGDAILQISHIFIDEYQDFPNQQLDIIHQLTDIVPYSICVDYTQAIYRPPRKQVVEAVSIHNEEVVELSYCYRLNDQVIPRLKNVMTAARIMANYGSGNYELTVLPREESIFDSLSPAVFGPSPTIFKYDSTDDLNRFLESHVSQVSSRYTDDELVVTAFFPEIYKYATEGADYMQDAVPEPVQR